MLYLIKPEKEMQPYWADGERSLAEETFLEESDVRISDYAWLDMLLVSGALNEYLTINLDK
jgi:hypothetical protein